MRRVLRDRSATASAVGRLRRGGVEGPDAPAVDRWMPARYGFSVKPSPVASACCFEGADPIDQAIEMLAEAGVGAGAAGRLEQDVEGAVELAARACSRWPRASSCWPLSKCESDSAMSVRDGIPAREPARAGDAAARAAPAAATCAAFGPLPDAQPETSSARAAARATVRRKDLGCASASPTRPSYRTGVSSSYRNSAWSSLQSMCKPSTTAHPGPQRRKPRAPRRGRARRA